MAILLAAALIVQFAATTYVPVAYWLAVVLISVVGTLFSDNLVDNYGVSLWTTSAIFSAGLIASFVARYRSEKTLSIHTIVTRRREAFYWLTILFTFPLGTSAGDLVAEQFAVGYLPSALLFGTAIAAITAVFYVLKANAVIAFWAAYIVTRPFVGSMGDFLTASTKDGGLGIGTNGTSAIFLVIIVGCVAWFTVKEQRTGRQLEAA